jgi:hypothetical protein
MPVALSAVANFEHELKAKEAAIAKRRELYNAIKSFRSGGFVPVCIYILQNPSNIPAAFRCRRPQVSWSALTAAAANISKSRFPRFRSIFIGAGRLLLALPYTWKPSRQRKSKAMDCPLCRVTLAPLCAARFTQGADRIER